MSGIFQMVAIGGFVLAVLGIALAISSSSQGRPARGGLLITVAGGLIGIIFMVMSLGLVTVPVTERAVIYNSLTGQLEGVRGPGITLLTPGIQQPIFYPINNQTYYMTDDEDEGARFGQDAVIARSIEGQQVRVNAILTFRLNTEGNSLQQLHQTWSATAGGYIEGFIRPRIVNVVNDVISTYTAPNIYGTERVAIAQQITTQLTEVLRTQGIVLVEFNVLELGFSPEFTEAIERQVIANQEQERERTEAETRQIIAEGEAQAITIRAQAEADALEAISQQIEANPALIQYRYVENLSDNVQIILVPANSPFLFDSASLGITPTQPESTPSAP
jgi:regulator of protease activity HflC (stomatin/prohibitin superfamily)